MRSLLLLLSLACAPSPSPAEPSPPPAETPPPPPPPPAEEELAPVERSAAIDDAVRALLLAEDWAATVDALTDNGEPDAAFVRAWALVQLDRAGEIDGAENLLGPEAHRAFILGHALMARGEPVQAAAALRSVPEWSSLRPRALAEAARAFESSARREEAIATLRELVQVEDPVTGTDSALSQLVTWVDDPGYALRIWRHYPGTDADRSLGPIETTWRDATHRALALNHRGDWQGVLDLLTPHLEQLSTADEDVCRARYAYGRALYKKNDLKGATRGFGSFARQCAAIDPVLGPKLAYLTARTEYRRKRWRTAAARYREMAEDYPGHRFADDGYVMAGFALSKVGDIAGARDLWRKAAETYPEGDLVPEALFRLAWSLYAEGRGEDARAAAAALGSREVTSDTLYVDAGRYWAGRWALYPTVDDPRSRDEAGRDAAIAQWRTLVEERPWTYYAVLAFNRLREEAPDVARSLEPRMAETAETSTWTLSRAFLDDPARRAASELLRLGLVDEASHEWDKLTTEATKQEFLWWNDSRRQSGDWLTAHAQLRAWLKTQAIRTDTPGARSLLHVAHPDHWLPEVTTATGDYRFPARYFHGLVRTESNFDPQAISWAGARGLCQVMPATGRGVGKWMGMVVTPDDLLIPETNLRVGARYLEFLHKRFNDSPFLSAAGYNAGEHRVDQWLERFGNLPTDEFVERIPFDETRNYVKSVVGTWQMYHWLRGSGPALLDLSRFNLQAKPDSSG